MKLTPFTKENYPHGYSRKDCEQQLQSVESSIHEAKQHLKSLAKEQKTLKQQLRKGGHMEF